MIGTMRRLRRLFDATTGKAVLLPLDHGVSEGMLSGLEAIPELLRAAGSLPVQGVVLNKGLARAVGAAMPADRQLVVQLSAGTKHGLPTYNQSVVCSVEEAHRLGADAVSLQVNIGNELEDRMLQDFGTVTDEAHLLGLPVIAVVYARGGQIVNELDPSLIGHCIRLGGELGADVVCAPYSGNAESFGRAVSLSSVPVLVTGGPGQPDWKSFLSMIGEALSAGASGVAIGRNIFQHPAPLDALAAVCDIVHGQRPE
ncbi:class I fructose-bisphosphate aldolase [Desulfobaculum xiamenense]|uniref:Class I fructose-bisphosphate aldolase n=1 Tax=Desulfobaculum xiamenense TaxID=995050 RepID=A0A846QNI6_9BACT|nr:2-amino-3,7-dideoxy-D-threo-hept-6-ulosonate synthase [Desulfobaculum xiamenense]NJB68022.1 class I fructose-bisphosphate aldolase [Desulfobaculum xiamenense]